MPANARVTRAAEDNASELLCAVRGTNHEIRARRNLRYIRAQAGLLRFIESLARDGMIAGNALGEYADVLNIFASPVEAIEDENSDAA